MLELNTSQTLKYLPSHFHDFKSVSSNLSRTLLRFFYAKNLGMKSEGRKF